MGNDNRTIHPPRPIFIGPSNVADTIEARAIGHEVLIKMTKDGAPLHARLSLSGASLLIQSIMQAMNEAYHTSMLQTGDVQ